ncbi:hypothetical protein [Actinosynnema sp. NPDC020468]|uniref:hypothetical protein n=1 Tax=Actinosynnema sp. NPDC020468 TaxID=3154488 RepID=UPI0033F82DB6
MTENEKTGPNRPEDGAVPPTGGGTTPESGNPPTGPLPSAGAESTPPRGAPAQNAPGTRPTTGPGTPSGPTAPTGPTTPSGPGTPTGQGSPPPYQPATPPVTAQPGGKGRIRQQEPGRTKARPPTLAEQRAREQAVRDQQEEELRLQAEAARKRRKRKRLLIGGGVTAGVVGVVAIWYAASSAEDVEAQCTKDDVVVDDQYCDASYASSHGGYSSGGFIYIGGSSYRYHYGGSSVPVGTKVAGGSYTIPKGANVATKSGTSIQRGGFGISSKSGSSSSGGSKSGGS